MNSKYIITSLQRSLCYLTYCLVQLTVSSALLIYVLLDRNNLNKPIVVILELALTITILIDILLKLINEGSEFIQTGWNLVDILALITILLCISLYIYYEVYFDELFGIWLISIRYLSLSIRVIIVLKQSYLLQLMQHQRDILIYKRSKHNDMSILDISSEIHYDSDFVERMKLISD